MNTQVACGSAASGGTSAGARAHSSANTGRSASQRSLTISHGTGAISFATLRTVSSADGELTMPLTCACVST